LSMWGRFGTLCEGATLSILIISITCLVIFLAG